ncbi:MAG: PTS sugar transporter subunit IIB [Erysipelotrichaceae bacterium]
MNIKYQRIDERLFHGQVLCFFKQYQCQKVVCVTNSNDVDLLCCLSCCQDVVVMTSDKYNNCILDEDVVVVYEDLYTYYLCNENDVDLCIGGIYQLGENKKYYARGLFLNDEEISYLRFINKSKRVYYQIDVNEEEVDILKIIGE